jgi:hypothetical protein
MTTWGSITKRSADVRKQQHGAKIQLCGPGSGGVTASLGTVCRSLPNPFSTPIRNQRTNERYHDFCPDRRLGNPNQPDCQGHHDQGPAPTLAESIFGQTLGVAFEAFMGVKLLYDTGVYLGTLYVGSQ